VQSGFAHDVDNLASREPALDVGLRARDGGNARSLRPPRSALPRRSRN